MQGIENDMDELFRKAVDHYTLEPGISNWNTIVSQLPNDETITITENNRKNNIGINVILSLMLLFIPVSTVMYSYYYNGIALTKPEEGTNTLSYKPYRPEIDVNTTVAIQKNAVENTADKHRKDNAATAPIYSTEAKKNIQIKPPADQVNDLENTSRKADGASLSESISTHSPEAANTKIDSQQNTAINILQPITTKTSTMQKSRIYAGLIAGITFNEVKRQGFNKPGFDAGIIAGYRMSKNASVEVGLLYSKKYYFSNGKYFSMNKMSGSMPAEMEVLSLEGSSNMYQLPVAFKYDIIYKKGSALFSSAGISSYILTKEKNDYQIAMNGVQQNMQGMYKHVSAGFASSIDVSIGYEYTAPRSIIRVQPYLQIPLKGMGMGSMQVLSTGLHIAYMRQKY